MNHKGVTSMENGILSYSGFTVTKFVYTVWCVCACVFFMRVCLRHVAWVCVSVTGVF